MMNRRAQHAAALALGLVAAACAGSREAPVRTEVSTVFDRAAGEIRVTVAGLRPAERVESLRLVGPDDAHLAPRRRTHHESVEARRGHPTVGVQARGGSASGIEPGLSLSFDLFDWTWSGSETRRRRAVRAVFAVPEGYRNRPEAWRVEIVVTDPTGAARTRHEPVASP